MNTQHMPYMMIMLHANTVVLVGSAKEGACVVCVDRH